MTTAKGTMNMPQAISSNQVRYIKLGWHGEWEKDCVRNGIIRLGFWTGKPSRFKLCSAGKWEALRKVFLREGSDPIRASIFTNQVRHFFEDVGGTLWITFHGDHMYWGVLESDAPQADAEGRTWRTVVDGWRCYDLIGRELTKARVSVALAKYAQFPGTSCDLKKVRKVVIGVVNGKRKRAK
jgi:hypothetical protein